MRPHLKNTAVALTSLLLLAVLLARACDWAVGYFYEMTALKGQVVGTTFHGLPSWF